MTDENMVASGHDDVRSQGATGPVTGTSELRAAYLRGQYAAYRLLLTSPRMNKPQREVITECALAVKADIEALLRAAGETS